jgi:DNA-binding transcriptional LysR family regulator
MNYLKQFECVIMVSRYGSISRAADEMGISQPTLSKYLRKIEDDLGVELFDRSTIPLRMTHAGKCYIETGRKLIDIDHQLHKQLLEIKLNKSMEVRVGISPSRAPYLLPPIIKEYQKKNRSGKIIIEEGTVAKLNEQLTNGDLDMIISLHDESTINFERIDLFEERILLAVKKDHADISPFDILRTMPLITVGRGQRLWYLLNDIISEINGKEAQIECQSIESALALVKAGIGVTIVPSYIAEYGQNEDIRFYPLSFKKQPRLETEAKRCVCLFYRREQFLTEAEREFIKCTKKVIKNAFLPQ